MSLPLGSLVDSPSIAGGLERVRDALHDDARAAGTAVAALVPLIAAASENEATSLARAIVSLASTATGKNQPAVARALLLHSLVLLLGDPHQVALTRAGARGFRPASSGARAGAYRGLVEERAALMLLASEPPFEEPDEPEEADGLVCGLARRTELASAARLVCSFLPREQLDAALRSRLDAEDDAWGRAYGLLWMDEPGAEAAARDVTQPALVRAAAIIRAGVDDVVGGSAPRREVLEIFAELVDRGRARWGAQWAPVSLFAEHADRDAVALLSPSARVRCGAARPERAQQIEQVLLAVLDALPDHQSQRAALAGNVVHFAFAGRVSSWPCASDDSTLVPLLEELTPRERTLLEHVARSVSILEWDYDVHHALFDVGLPASFSGLRRYLQIDPAGPMDTLITVPMGGEPRTLPLGLAAQRMLVGMVDQADLARAMTEAFAPRELAVLACEAFSGFDARLHCTGPEKDEAKITYILDELRLSAIAGSDPSVMFPALCERADRLLDGLAAPGAASMTLRAMARLLEPRRELLPDRFDGLVAGLLQTFPPDPQTARALLLGVVPQDRRDRIILRDRQRTAFGPPHDYSDLLSEEMRGLVTAVSTSKVLQKTFEALCSLIPMPKSADGSSTLG